MPATWPEARWLAALQQRWPDAQVQVVQETGSTNTDLMQMLRDGGTRPSLRVARQQSAGRGRLGRAWHARPGAALTFSLGLPLHTNDWSGLSLAVGVSVARSLHPQIGLKWPNDLWWQMRKLGGILIETVQLEGQRYAVIGVGINLLAPDADNLSTAPAWLGECLPGLKAPEVLDRLIAALADDLQVFARQGFAAFAEEFGARDVLRDLRVRLSDGIEGRAGGVDGSGALLVHTAAGVRAVNSSEVSVRPEPPSKPC